GQFIILYPPIKDKLCIFILMKETIKQILVENQQRFTPAAKPRKAKIDSQLPKIQVITGPRRAGKSSLLRITIAELLNQGLSWDQICYLPLEDERLRSLPFEADIILQAFQELHTSNPLLKDVLFVFDEIQYLPHWEAFVNRIHQQISKRVILTGSNSRTLHTEVANILRGRSLAVELLPLSFAEYLQFRHIPFSYYGTESIQSRAAFHDYLMLGGYPETAGMEINYSRNLLQEYFNTAIYRDILDQAQPASYSYLRYVFHRLAANTGKTTSISKVYNELKSQGYAVSKNSLYEMVQMAEDVYLYKRISRFDPSLIRRENSDKKGYFIDNGMLNAIDSGFSANRGALLENLVFWQLYRQYGSIYTTDIYYYKDASYECDFILYREGGLSLPIQVCWQMATQDTYLRELKGLSKACENAGATTGILITLEEENEMIYDGIKIKIIPAWKWCAEEIDLYKYT
ncbi:MAG: ATP-binding protein, partial [Saprospiraceae bacterium]